MPGKRVSPVEADKILTLFKTHENIAKVVELSTRARNTVKKVLKHKCFKVSKKTLGSPGKVTERDRRRICRLASNKAITAPMIQAELGLPITDRQILNIIHGRKYIVHRKLRKIAAISAENRAWRISWAKMACKWTKEDYDDMHFTDEKRFTLDGPDGYQYYWHDLRKMPIFLEKSKKGAQGIMFWGAISARKRKLVTLKGRVDSAKYQEMLREKFFPILTPEEKKRIIFQQDNAPPHVSKSTLKFFKDNNMKIMEWPANSPDLNPMENVWGLLVQKVYANNKRYTTLQELEQAVFAAFEAIPQDDLRNLVYGVEDRVFNLVLNQGYALLN